MIPKGYQVHITTWENDGDNYSTQILSGLTAGDVTFYIAIASKFKMYREPEIGNSYVPAEKLAEIISDILKQSRPTLRPEVVQPWVEALEKFTADEKDEEEWAADFIYENLLELLGSPSEFYCDEPNFCRMVESIKVFYIPEDCEDITDEFYIGD